MADDQRQHSPLNAGPQQLIAAWSELNLVLSFFGRVDTKLSVVLGIDLGMVGLLLSKLPSQLTEINLIGRWSLLVFVLNTVVSLIQLYRGSFPNIVGGTESLTYFRAIAKRREVTFVDEFSAQTSEQLARDVLCQVWRNSEILSQKFTCLKWAYIAMAIAIIPWVICLLGFYNQTCAIPGANLL